MKTKVLLIAIFVVIFQSCVKKGESVDPEPAPVTPAPIVYTKVFYDDFKDNSNNWFQASDDTVYSNIDAGFLYFSNKIETRSYCVVKNILLDETKNFSVKASFNWLAGVNYYGYGITWGRANWDNYHAFLINNSNQFTAYSRRNGVYGSIQDWIYSNQINTNQNILEVRKEGGQLVFLANGMALVKKPYKAFMGNEIGFQIENKREISIDYIDIVQW
jgi:hypothetical protein